MRKQLVYTQGILLHTFKMQHNDDVIIAQIIVMKDRINQGNEKGQIVLP